MTGPYAAGTALTGVVELAQEFGIDAYALAFRAGIPRSAFDHPELRVSVPAVGRLLSLCAGLSGCEDFGLRLAARRRLSNWGAVALVARSQPTLRDVVDKLGRYIGLQSDAMRITMNADADPVELRLDTVGYDTSPFRRHGVELAIGALYRNIQEIIGEAWRPLCVCFRHGRPKTEGAHEAFFKAELRFEQPFDGFLLRPADLELRTLSPDTAMASYAETYALSLLQTRHRTLSNNVVELALVLLPQGGCSREQLANAMGLSIRTLQRRLAEEGSTFSELVNEARDQLARLHLDGSRMPFSEVARHLGFASQSAFNQWHQSRHGLRPTERRRRAGRPD